MNLDREGHKQRTSYCGAISTLVLFTLLGLFCYNKVIVLSERSDVTIILNTVGNAFEDSHKFTAEDGFFVAAAITNYDTETESEEDERYGRLMFKHYAWGDGALGTTEIDSYNCSDEELGLSDSGSGSGAFP